MSSDSNDNDAGARWWRLPQDKKLARIRKAIEWRRPWWRRDVLLEALEAAYPLWLPAPQIAAICIEIEPRYRKCSRFVTARSLGRLHEYRMVDRIGRKMHIGPAIVPGRRGHPRPSGDGYRYRLRKI